MKAGRYAGFTLVETIVSVAIGGVITLGLATMLARTAQMQAKALELSSVESMKQALLRNLAYGPAWQNTLTMNAANLPSSGMRCLTDATPCTVDGSAGGAPIKDRPFALFAAEERDLNKPLFDATQPSNGFTAKGALCDGFDAIRGNDGCPFRYEITWTASCALGNCVSPQVKISAILKYSPAGGSAVRAAIDPDRYSINNYYRSTGTPDPADCSPNSKLYTMPGTYTFQVPDTFNAMDVEVWGAGGGGAAIPWNCAIGPGTAGESSSFGALVTANGGAAGTRAGSGLYWMYFCVGGMGCGFGAYVPNYCGGTDPPAFLSPDPNCAPGNVCAGGTGQGGSGRGVPPNMCNAKVGGAGLGGQTYFANGSAAGGGGAGTTSSYVLPIPPFGCLGGQNWCTLQYWGVEAQGGGSNVAGVWTGGLYNYQRIVPGMVARGSSVTVTVGAGGPGGAMGGLKGGNGAHGMVRVTWW